MEWPAFRLKTRDHIIAYTQTCMHNSLTHETTHWISLITYTYSAQKSKTRTFLVCVYHSYLLYMPTCVRHNKIQYNSLL